MCLNYGESVMASFRPIFLSTTDETLLVEIASYIVHPFYESFFEGRRSPFINQFTKKDFKIKLFF